MKYTKLENYAFRWVFKRADLNLDVADVDMIKPLHPDDAKQLWHREVSPDSFELDRLSSDHWLLNEQTWSETHPWHQAFESDDVSLPAALANHLNWDPMAKVYVCYDSEHILEVRYSVFKRCWKGFLFAADQALIINNKRKECLFFVDENNVKQGMRPA